MRSARQVCWVAIALVTLAGAAAAQPAEPEAWLVARSANFAVYSDAEAERAVEIATGLERLRDAFARLIEETRLVSEVSEDFLKELRLP